MKSTEIDTDSGNDIKDLDGALRRRSERNLLKNNTESDPITVDPEH